MPQDDGASPSVRAVVQRLESLKRAGVTHLPKRRAKAAAVNIADASAAPATATKSTASRPRTTAVAAAMPAVAKGGSTNIAAPATAADLLTPDGFSRAPLAPTKRLAALQVIQQEVTGCTACGLASSRTQTVFGVGNPNARLLFVGEAPGADEDAQGVPFVGRAGQLLTKIIEACTLSRDDVYILNVLKCRPPGNRTPEPDEVTACRGFLERQIEAIRPEFICCLGAVAARTVLDSQQSIGQLRGKFHSFHGIPVLCTYHPSYLLRNPAAKRDVWEDMKILMGRMGIDVGQGK